MLSSPETGERMTTETLESEAVRRRQRLSENVDELSVRMMPSNLLAEATHAMWGRVDEMADVVLAKAQHLAEDGMDWARQHRMVSGGALAALLAGGILAWSVSRRKPVPLYAAYDMEDPSMLNDIEENFDGKARNAWGKVKSEAHDLGDKAGDAYQSAKARAAEISDEARDRAREAAHVAREKAHEAAVAAREAADRAREAAGEAGRWAKRQQQENPVTVVVAALAAGVLIGALLPTFRRNNED